MQEMAVDLSLTPGTKWAHMFGTGACCIATTMSCRNCVPNLPQQLLQAASALYLQAFTTARRMCLIPAAQKPLVVAQGDFG